MLAAGVEDELDVGPTIVVRALVFAAGRRVGRPVVDVQCASGRDGDIALRVAQAIADAVPATVRG